MSILYEQLPLQLPEKALCACGCGQPAPLARHTRSSKGIVKGQPCRFVSGHYQVVDIPVGTQFAKLTVLGRAKSIGHHQVCWHCHCECGQNTVVGSYDLRHGHTRSCGCGVAETNRRLRRTHGAASHGNRPSEYSIWCGIIKRCENPNCPAYARYGGRGITIDPTWRHDFARFLRDVGPRPGQEYSIDRIDNDGNYAPGNVRWATRTEQARNRRKPRPRGDRWLNR